MINVSSISKPEKNMSSLALNLNTTISIGPSLVPFDQKGIIGPAMSLIYNNDCYTPKGILEIADLLKKNYLSLAKTKPTGKKEFCAFIDQCRQFNQPVTATDVVSRKFFQNMQKAHSDPVIHQKIMDNIVPAIVRTFEGYVPQLGVETKHLGVVTEWMGYVLESYLTNDQIEKISTGKDSVNDQIMEERKKIGIELTEAAMQNKINALDLVTLVHACEAVIKVISTANHAPKVGELTGKYIQLFSMKEDPKKYSEEVLPLIETAFKNKFFPQK
jgi:hypothetical protein